MKWFPELRIFAMLRRIARALERSNEIEEERVSLELGHLRTKKPKPAVISQGDPKEWNARYAAERDNRERSDPETWEAELHEDQ
jgi:hypothetical protein